MLLSEEALDECVNAIDWVLQSVALEEAEVDLLIFPQCIEVGPIALEEQADLVKSALDQLIDTKPMVLVKVVLNQPFVTVEVQFVRLLPYLADTVVPRF